MQKIEIGPIDRRLLEPIEYCISKNKKGIIKDLEITRGYAYRAIERTVKGKMYADALYMIERVCGICTNTHTINFCQAIESILGLTIPERASYIRVVTSELERIQSHFIALSEIMHAIGEHDLQVRFLICREKILRALEELSGKRIFHSINVVGGVKWDMQPHLSRNIIGTLHALNRQNDGFLKNVKSKRINSKLQGRGILKNSTALALGVVGPVARGSGVDLDIRKKLPYAAYQKIPFSVITEKNGDSRARVMVRLKEIGESIGIIVYALRNMPEGSISVKPSNQRTGFTASRTEAPRGELLHFVKLSDHGTIENYHLRTPTNTNINALKCISVGENIDQFMLLATSLDPCVACCDSVAMKA